MSFLTSRILFNFLVERIISENKIIRISGKTIMMEFYRRRFRLYSEPKDSKKPVCCQDFRDLIPGSIYAGWRLFLNV